MKTIKNIFIALFLSPSLLLAQNNEEMIHLDQEHQSEIFLEQNLADFNAKYHSIFIASYKGFEGITKGEMIVKNDTKFFKTSIDFLNGINEMINVTDNLKSFRVTFGSNNDEMIAIALQKELVNRIMTVSPKGFVQSNKRVESKEIIAISFDPNYAEKATFQPTIAVILDYNTLTVQVIINEPLKK